MSTDWRGLKLTHTVYLPSIRGSCYSKRFYTEKFFISEDQRLIDTDVHTREEELYRDIFLISEWGNLPLLILLCM